MQRFLAIVLLCVPALVWAGERCPSSHASRDAHARHLVVKPVAARSEIVRARKSRPLLAWQRTILFEQQIL